jgi:hypothetical protein
MVSLWSSSWCTFAVIEHDLHSAARGEVSYIAYPHPTVLHKPLILRESVLTVDKSVCHWKPCKQSFSLADLTS